MLEILLLGKNIIGLYMGACGYGLGWGAQASKIFTAFASMYFCSDDSTKCDGANSSANRWFAVCRKNAAKMEGL
jgi:hypothetical protein